MQEILWERTANGKPAKLKTLRTGIKKSGMVLKELVFSKMSDVDLISADFQGTPLVFALLLGLSLDRGTHMEYMGIYQSTSPVEEENNAQTLPTLCLRRSLWDKTQDYKRFNMAESKRAYVESEEQINSRIIFIKDDPEINALVQEIQLLIHQGIHIIRVSREEHSWRDIRIDLRDEVVVFALSYTPFTHANHDLERLLANLQKSFAQIDFSGGIAPDDSCSISYPPSILERLNSFSE